MLIDLCGWVGAFLILLAYYLVSIKRVAGDSAVYQLINLIDAITLMINTYAKGAIPSAVLNIIWSAIAVRSLLKSRK